MSLVSPPSTPAERQLTILPSRCDKDRANMRGKMGPKALLPLLGSSCSMHRRIPPLLVLMLLCLAVGNPHWEYWVKMASISKLAGVWHSDRCDHAEIKWWPRNNTNSLLNLMYKYCGSLRSFHDLCLFDLALNSSLHFTFLQQQNLVTLCFRPQHVTC